MRRFLFSAAVFVGVIFFAFDAPALIHAQGNSLLFNIGIVDRRANPASGIWWSPEGVQADRPRLEVRYSYNGQSITKNYQHGLNGMQNAYATYIRPSTSCGDGTANCRKHEILAKKSPAATGFFRADIGDIPVGAQITSAQLHLHFHEAEGLAGAEKSGALEVFEVSRIWDWDTMNWNSYAAGKNWSTAGGDFGSKIRDISIQNDFIAHGWSKSNPRGSLDFTQYVQDLQVSRGGAGGTTGGGSVPSGICNLYNSGEAAPTGYGTAWNPLTSAREMLLNSYCSGGAGQGVEYTVGTGNPNHYIYNVGYFYTSQWNAFSFTGAPVQDTTAWLAGEGTYTNSNPPSSDYFWVGYVCQWQSNTSTWKCGCRDSACTTNYWQLQGVRYPTAGGGATAGATTGGSTTGGGSGTGFDFPHKTDFLTTGCYTHVFPGLSASARQNCLNGIKNRGYTHFYVYVYNENDYKGPSFDFYNNINGYKSLLQEIINAGLKPVVWLNPDDAPVNKQRSDAELKSRMSALVPAIDSMVSSYVLGLELDEYWNQSKVDTLGKHLNTLTDKKIAVHQLSVKWDFCKLAWCDYMMLQYGFGKNESQIKTITTNAINDLGKPVVAAEYYHETPANETIGRKLGDAAVSMGAKGFGNGGTP